MLCLNLLQRYRNNISRLVFAFIVYTIYNLINQSFNLLFLFFIFKAWSFNKLLYMQFFRLTKWLYALNFMCLVFMYIFKCDFMQNLVTVDWSNCVEYILGWRVANNYMVRRLFANLLSWVYVEKENVYIWYVHN